MEGGPFTRQDPATGKLSCLDLSIVCKDLRPYIQKLEIDSKRKMTPARAMRIKGKQKLVFTDHFSTLLTFANLPKRTMEKEPKVVKWNLAKEGGWDRYKEISDQYSEAIEKVLNNQEDNVEEAMKKFNKIHNKIK